MYLHSKLIKSGSNFEILPDIFQHEWLPFCLTHRTHWEAVLHTAAISYFSMKKLSEIRQEICNIITIIYSRLMKGENSPFSCSLHAEKHSSYRAQTVYCIHDILAVSWSISWDELLHWLTVISVFITGQSSKSFPILFAHPYFFAFPLPFRLSLARRLVGWICFF